MLGGYWQIIFRVSAIRSPYRTTVHVMDDTGDLPRQWAKVIGREQLRVFDPENAENAEILACEWFFWQDIPT